MSNSNTKYFTRGGQITFHNWRMLFQINKSVAKLYFFIFAVSLVGFVYLLAPSGVLVNTAYYYLSQVLAVVGYTEHQFMIAYQGHQVPESVAVIVSHPFFKQVITMFKEKLALAAFYSLLVALGSVALTIIYFIKFGKTQTNNHFVRGSQIEKSKHLAKTIRRGKKASDLHIDGFPLVKDGEVQHLLVHGTIGTGKSQLIMKLLDRLRARGDKVIVYDKGCALMPHYYDDTQDSILNPFDKRCVNWDLWREARTPSDFENIAEGLIPLHGETDPFWVQAARTVFSSVAMKMQTDPERSIDKLLQLILTGELTILESYLTGTPAATLVSNKIEKTAISVRSVITTYLKSLQSLTGLADDNNPPFSIHDWIKQEDSSGWLFISSNGERHITLKPLISMWMGLASLTLLSLNENRDRRIWFICDELPSLHRLPMLGETIAEARKFGGCFVLGMQSVAQLEKVYGRASARGIFDLLNTRFFFRSPSADIAEIVSRELGVEELEDARENYSYGANSVRDGISIGRQRQTRPMVTYPEIMNLPNLSCYLRLAGGYPLTQLTLNYQQRPLIHSGFIERHRAVVDSVAPPSSSACLPQETDTSSSPSPELGRKPSHPTPNQPNQPITDELLEPEF